MIEREVCIAVLPKCNTREANGLSQLHRAGIKMPYIRWKKPRPPERFAGVNYVGRDWAMFWDPYLQSDTAAFEQIKAVRRFPYPKDHLVLLESRRRGRLRQSVDMALFHSLKERMCRQAFLNIFVLCSHGVLIGRCRRVRNFDQRFVARQRPWNLPFEIASSRWPRESLASNHRAYTC